MIVLLQIFSCFWQWNNFENRLIFGKVKAYRKKWCQFFWATLYLPLLLPRYDPILVRKNYCWVCHWKDFENLSVLCVIYTVCWLPLRTTQDCAWSGLERGIGMSVRNKSLCQGLIEMVYRATQVHNQNVCTVKQCVYKDKKVQQSWQTSALAMHLPLTR